MQQHWTPVSTPSLKRLLLLLVLMVMVLVLPLRSVRRVYFDVYWFILFPRYEYMDKHPRCNGRSKNDTDVLYFFVLNNNAG